MKIKTLPAVNNCYEIENLTRDQAKEASWVWKSPFNKEFELAVIIEEGYFGMCMLLYKDGKQIYWTSEIHHKSHWNYETKSIQENTRLEKYKRMIAEINRYAVPYEELDKFNDYQTYVGNKYYAFNYLPKAKKAINLFSCPKEYKALKYTWHHVAFMWLVESEDDANEITDALKRIGNRHLFLMNSDMEYFKSAVQYEFFNFECGIGGRWDEALSATGFEGKLTDQQKQIVREQMHYVIEHTNC